MIISNTYFLIKSLIKGLIKPFRNNSLLLDKSTLNYYRNFYKFSSSKYPIHPRHNSLSRVDIINQFIDGINTLKRAQIKYLELGCDNNKCFKKIKLPLSQKIGVDPNKGGTLRMTSDEFFEKCENRFDIIFIDGLHIYEQVQKDIINSLAFLKPDGKIIIHDMLPSKWENECVPRVYKSWNGDVWKIGVELEKSTGIDLKIFDCDNGVGVVKKLSSSYRYIKMNELLCNQSFKDFLYHTKNLPIYGPDSFHDIYFKDI